VNNDNSLVVTITVTCYSWVPSCGDHSFTCGAICWRPHSFKSFSNPADLFFHQDLFFHLFFHSIWI